MEKKVIRVLPTGKCCPHPYIHPLDTLRGKNIKSRVID